MSKIMSLCHVSPKKQIICTLYSVCIVEQVEEENRVLFSGFGSVSPLFLSLICYLCASLPEQTAKAKVSRML